MGGGSTSSKSWPPQEASSAPRRSWPPRDTSPPAPRKYELGAEIFEASGRDDGPFLSYATDGEAYELMKARGEYTDFTVSLMDNFKKKGWSDKQRPFAHRDAAATLEKRNKDPDQVSTVELGEDAELQAALETRDLPFSSNTALGAGELRVARRRVASGSTSPRQAGQRRMCSSWKVVRRPRLACGSLRWPARA